MLTTAQVAKRVGLCRAAVTLAVKEGRLLPLAKLPTRNGAYLFTEAAVVEWRCPGDRLAGL